MFKGFWMAMLVVLLLLFENSFWSLCFNLRSFHRLIPCLSNYFFCYVQPTDEPPKTFCTLYIWPLISSVFLLIFRIFTFLSVSAVYSFMSNFLRPALLTHYSHLTYLSLSEMGFAKTCAMSDPSAMLAFLF